MTTAIKDDTEFDDILKLESAFLFLYEDFSERLPSHPHLSEIFDAQQNLYISGTWNSKHITAWVYSQPECQVRNEKNQLTSITTRGALLKLRCGKIQAILFNVVQQPIEQIRTFFDTES